MQHIHSSISSTHSQAKYLASIASSVIPNTETQYPERYTKTPKSQYSKVSLSEQLSSKSKAFTELVGSISPRRLNQLSDCGTRFMEFQSDPNKAPTFIRSQCHSDLCIRCKKDDHRKQKRVRDVVGLELYRYCDWLKVVVTTPDYLVEEHFTNYDNLLKLATKSWEMLRLELNIWNGLDRYDRSGAIVSIHWFGDTEDRYAPHIELYIPCIRYGLPFPARVDDKEEFNARQDRCRKKLSKIFTNITKTDVPIEKTNIHFTPKEELVQKVHGSNYQTRNTISVDKLMKCSDAVQKFIIGERFNRRNVIYKGKLFGTEIKGFYDRCGLDYKNRNGESKGIWKDLDGFEYKFKKLHKVQDFRKNGLGLQRLSPQLYCYKDKDVFSEKASELISKALKTSHHMAKKSVSYLKSVNFNNWKVDFPDDVIGYAKEHKYMQLIDPDLASEETIHKWSKLKIKKLDKV